MVSRRFSLFGSVGVAGELKQSLIARSKEGKERFLFLFYGSFFYGPFSLVPFLLWKFESRFKSKG